VHGQLLVVVFFALQVNLFVIPRLQAESTLIGWHNIFWYILLST
jgi:hypothetical protein